MSDSKKLVSSWLFAAGALGAVCLLLGLLAAPMLLPILLGETWWAFAFMGLAYFVVISLIVAVLESM